MTMTTYKKRLKVIEREIAQIEQKELLERRDLMLLETLYVEYNHLCELMEPVFI